MSRELIIIGDRFAGFATAEPVRTVAQARALLARLGRHGDDDTVIIRYGQGVSDYEHALLMSDVDRLGLLNRVAFRHKPMRLCGRREVHKNCEVNVLIANLAADGGGYVADLRIHNDNELLLDHQTGLHVQGMVITEAARQMFLAVSERFLVPATSEHEYYYVIERMASSYENFLFPLASTLRFTPKSVVQVREGRVAIECEIEMFQAARRCVRTEVAFTAFAPSIIGTKEEQRAIAAVDAERTGFTSALV